MNDVTDSMIIDAMQREIDALESQLETARELLEMPEDNRWYLEILTIRRRNAELEEIDKQFCKWMDVVDEMSIGRGEHTVDFYVKDGMKGKTIIEPRKVNGIYEAMRQHFNNYRTTRVERAEHENYDLTKRIEELETQLAQAVKGYEARGRWGDRLEKQLEAKQFEIDNLMLEYCPDEMTEEQRKNWGEYQVEDES